MIKLNADESMLVLITKGWESKLFPYTNKNIEAFTFTYIQKVCQKRCNTEYVVNLFQIYSHLAEKLLTVKDLFESMKYIDKGDSVTEAIIASISMIKCTDIEFDYSLVSIENTGEI